MKLIVTVPDSLARETERRTDENFWLKNNRKNGTI